MQCVMILYKNINGCNKTFHFLRYDPRFDLYSVGNRVLDSCQCGYFVASYANAAAVLCKYA